MLKHPKINLALITTTDFRGMNYRKPLKKRIDVMLDINYLSMKYWLANNNYLEQVRFITSTLIFFDPFMLKKIDPRLHNN